MALKFSSWAFLVGGGGLENFSKYFLGTLI